MQNIKILLYFIDKMFYICNNLIYMKAAEGEWIMKRKDLPKLIKEIQAGNEEAFAKLYHDFYIAFYYMALKLTQNEADAQDAVQDTFINIRKNINHLKSPDVVIVWMKQILMNRCKNMFRKNREIYMDESTLAALDIADQNEDSLPSAVVRKKSNTDIVLKLLGNIPYIYREPLILKYYDDAKMSEIAEVLAIPEGTVKSRLRTGKQLLRKQIRLYEAQNHEKLSFYCLPTGFLMFYCFHQSAPKPCEWNLGKVSFFKRSASIQILSVALICLTSVIGVSAFSVYEWKKAAVMDGEYAQEVKDQDAYFILRKKAHCEEEIKQLDHGALNELLPYVEQLKQSASPFYDLLSNDGWIQAYEEALR